MCLREVNIVMLLRRLTSSVDRQLWRVTPATIVEHACSSDIREVEVVDHEKSSTSYSKRQHGLSGFSAKCPTSERQDRVDKQHRLVFAEYYLTTILPLAKHKTFVQASSKTKTAKVMGLPCGSTRAYVSLSWSVPSRPYLLAHYDALKIHPVCSFT